MKRLFAMTMLFVACSFAADMTDLDNDGLPDVWEVAHGFRTNSATGIDGAYGDMDMDGLNNYAEYRAGYYVIGANVYSNYDWAVVGLSPTNAYSAGVSILDKYVYPTNAVVTLGWMFSDRDSIPDSWEMTNSFCSVESYDNHKRIGTTTMWEKYIQSVYREKLSVKVKLSYSGMNTLAPANVVLHFFSDSSMNGKPDAIGLIASPADWTGGMEVTLTNFVSGAIKTGDAFVCAFLDLDGDSFWDANEAFGVCKPFPTKMGCLGNTIAIDMTDYSASYLRLDMLTGRMPEDVLPGVLYTNTLSGDVLTEARKTETRVRIRRKTVDNVGMWQDVILDKIIKKPRGFLHEGDFLPLYNTHGLDWGLGVLAPGNGDLASMPRLKVVYDVFFGNEGLPTNLVKTFTVNFSSTRAKATLVSPLNGEYIYSSAPTFRWTMPEGYCAFAIQIKRGLSDVVSAPIFDSYEVASPTKDPKSGEYRYSPETFANSILPNGESFLANVVYSWRILICNPKFTFWRGEAGGGVNTTEWSSWQTFRLDGRSPMQKENCGNLGLLVKYRGAKNLANSWLDRTVVLAFDNPAFSGVPLAEFVFGASAQYMLTNSAVTGTNAVLCNVPYRNVFLSAFLDVDGDRQRGEDESFGYYKDESTFTPKPFLFSRYDNLAVTGVTIFITDADTDNDWYPDIFEYDQNAGEEDYLLETGPSTSTGDNAEVNPTLAP